MFARIPTVFLIYSLIAFASASVKPNVVLFITDDQDSVLGGMVIFIIYFYFVTDRLYCVLTLFADAHEDDGKVDSEERIDIPQQRKFTYELTHSKQSLTLGWF